MATRQRIMRIRRDYNKWVANQTLEDYALRFTAKRARRWSALRVANTALGAISFLALEAIGGTVTISYGFSNAVAAIMVVALVIFASSLPIAVYAARYGVDVDLLTRGAGFGYIGSTVTSLIYASFTFIFFAIEAVILASMLQACLGIPQTLGYLLCALAVIPLVTRGITRISRFQLWTQPVWLILQIVPFVFVFWRGDAPLARWAAYPGITGSGGFDLVGFGAAASVVFSLVAQIGEQVDLLRFLPPRATTRPVVWWAALLAGGPGWIIIGTGKLLAGSFLATMALSAGLAPAAAAQPVAMYRLAFGHVVANPNAALALAGLFVVIAQIKINVTNAYAGSIAWSNFFSRLTHSHPGRVVWVVFNIAIALLLMELGVYQAIEHTLVIYSDIAAAWVGALLADLVVNKPLRLSPPQIEFKRAHLHAVNPVGLGAMLLGVALSLSAYTGALGVTARALSPFLAFVVAFASAPLIAWGSGGRYYLARKPRARWAERGAIACVICEHPFEPEDMAYCPAYVGPICSLCCSLDARCHDTCKPAARRGTGALALLRVMLPAPLRGALGHFLAVFVVLIAAVGLILLAIYSQAAPALPAVHVAIGAVLWQAFLILVPIAGVGAWLLVLAQESRHVAEEESHRQTALLMNEIEAHRRTDAELQHAKEVAESANLAKNRYVVGISHELRSPLNAILGYAQLLERDPTVPEQRRDSVRIIRRSGEHLAGLIEGLLDISKIEAGRIELYRDRVRLKEFLDQLAHMFRLQAEAKGIGFLFSRSPHLPEAVYTDERRLRQILINLLSNAVKFTDRGEVRLHVRWRREIAEFEIEDTGVGILSADIERIFEPFERLENPRGQPVPGIGLGLTITRLLVQIMGGEIAVESRPGEGSRFRVRLMLSAAMQTAVTAPSMPRITGYKGEQLSVLIADDDPVHRGLMEDVLAPLGFVLFTAADGTECLRIARTCRPALYLIDLSMPGMHGWELARQLRTLAGTQAVIVIISANTAELSGHAAQSGVHDEVLAKPVVITDLLEKIGRRLSIEWTGPQEVPATPEPLPAALLDARQLEELRQLGTIGYVRGIRARLDALEQEVPAARPYVAHLRGFVAEFRLDAFMAALDAQRDG